MKRCTLILLSFLLCAFFLSAEETGWKTNLGLSYVATTGNTSTQTFSGKLDSQGPAGPIRCRFKGNYMLTRDNGSEKANKLDLSARGEKLIWSKLFAFIESAYLIDKYSGYDYRASIGPGLGLDLLANDMHQLKWLTSAIMYYDRFSVGDVETDSYGSVKTALNYGWNMQENVKFAVNGSYLVSLENSEKYFVNTDASMNVAINSRLAIGVSYQVNFQNSLPSPEIRKTDTAFTTSLIINL